MFIGNGRQAPGDRIDKLAGLQKEVRIGRPAESLIPECECFIDQHTRVRCHGLDNPCQNGPPEIIGHDNPVAGACRNRKGRAILQIKFDEIRTPGPASIPARQPVPGARCVLVDPGYDVASCKRQTEMPPAAAPHIEHPSTGSDPRQKPPYPLGRRRPLSRDLIAPCHACVP